MSTILRDGESLTEFEARQRAVRHDEGDDGLGESDAGAARAGMLTRKNATPAADAEPDAAKAQKDFLARRKATKKRTTEVPAREPVSVSEEAEEEEGDDDEEGEEEEFDAAAAKRASDARKTGGAR